MRTALSLAAAIALVACSPRAPQPTAALASPQVSASIPLAGTTWVLADLAGSELLPQRSMTLEFGDDGQFSGSDGCNRFHGTYGSDGASLHFGTPTAMTRRACPYAATAQVHTYFAAIRRVEAFRQEPHQLHLLDGMGRTIATYSSQQTTLSGSGWIVTGYDNGKQTMLRALAGTEITAYFGDNGRLTGHAGCNSYVADYDAEAPGLSIGMPRVTRKHCTAPAGVMEQERLYAVALQVAVNYRFSGDTLEMRTSTGALAVTMSRRAPE